MAIASIHDLVDAEEGGCTKFATWRKMPTQTTGAGIWFDLSMSPGNPTPNYFAAAPNTSIALARSTDGGLDHGGAVAPATKHLKTLMAMTQTATAIPLPLILCDYLMYYPFVDMSVTDWQDMTTIVTLPRSTTGAGVQIMAVVVASPTGVGNPRFQIRYTNSDGVTGRYTQVVTTGTQIVNGTIASTAAATARCVGPFIPLQPGDSGVRAIESVYFLDADVGLLTFVLVKPIASMAIRTIDAPAEKSFLMDGGTMPVISDDAYLNLICCPQGTLAAAPMHGTIQTVWS